MMSNWLKLMAISIKILHKNMELHDTLPYFILITLLQSDIGLGAQPKISINGSNNTCKIVLPILINKVKYNSIISHILYYKAKILWNQKEMY